MENKINIAKLLKDCPSGMELDCTMYENVYFDKIYDKDCLYQIGCYTINDGVRNSINFTKYGKFNTTRIAKCVIFPKGKTTWEGFVPPCKFKDGDILFVKSVYSWVLVYKESKNNEDLYKYVAIQDNHNRTYIVYDNNPLCCKEDVSEIRLATEEEKQKLFDAIKANGYKWNAETKTLEELIESKEDTDRIVMSGIYFDRENYADEVELHLGDYEIEIRDGKTYAVFKNQKIETLKPKFKVGDIIANGKTTIKISYIDDDCYYEIGGNIANRLYIKNQDDWELVKDNIKPKFKVGDRIIKRDSIVNSWIVSSVSSEYYGLKLPNGFEGIGVLPVVEQDDWELVFDIEPKFKKGDKIKHKVNTEWVCTIRRVEDRYYVDGHPTVFTILFDKQDEYELVPNKFDINTLKPFDKVLMRSSNAREWTATLYSHYNNNYFFGCGMMCQQCIPHEGNEHLLGTTDDCNDFYKTW